MSAVDVARRYFDAQTKGDIEGALAAFGAGARFFGPMGELPLPEGVRGYLQSFAASFPGNAFEVTNAFASGDQVAVEGLWVGTHEGTMMLPDGSEIPATHKSVRAPFATLLTVTDEKIQEHRGYWDMAGFLAQVQG